MDINTARQLVARDTREQDESLAGLSDDEVLAQLAADGVDAAEVEEWARLDVVSGELLDAYRLVVGTQVDV